MKQKAMFTLEFRLFESGNLLDWYLFPVTTRRLTLQWIPRFSKFWRMLAVLNLKLWFSNSCKFWNSHDLQGLSHKKFGPVLGDLHDQGLNSPWYTQNGRTNSLRDLQSAVIMLRYIKTNCFGSSIWMRYSLSCTKFFLKDMVIANSKKFYIFIALLVITTILSEYDILLTVSVTAAKLRKGWSAHYAHLVIFD